uniref:Putative CCR4-Not complex component, Not N-terminal domain-containing protein n=1 Tax=Helianthus annuus TaxID=4232 RepID=A0A251SGS0_HELAN
MGASRKLQGEIDRVLKKVQEGVDVFDSIWNKVYDTDNANQKEKFEADLKKEIKKLQRYRDQIKTWIQSSEIKDKKVSASYEQALMDARKLIEREMERFKICEKETKTKAFSKEGLGQQPKTDPKEKAKSETRDWLNNTVSELESQIDSFEAEMEGLSTHLESSITRHKAHIMKLELILRLLDNDELSPEQVNDVKEFIDDYVERNQEDFDEFEDVDMLYNTLSLDMVDALEDLVSIVPPGLVKGVGATSVALSMKNSVSSPSVQSPVATVPDQVEETLSHDNSSDHGPKTQLKSQYNLVFFSIASWHSCSYSCCCCCCFSILTGQSPARGILDNTVSTVPSSPLARRRRWRISWSGMVHQSPVSSLSNRMMLSQGGAKTSDGGDNGNGGDASGMTPRVFSPSGLQWRPGSPFKISMKGYARGRPEIAPDQREKFLQRFQQVQQQTRVILSLTCLRFWRKPQTILSTAECSFATVQSSKFTVLPQGGLGGALSAGPNNVTSAQQPSLIHLQSGQQTFMPAGSKDTEIGNAKADEMEQQQNLPEDSAADPAQIAGINKNAANEEDSKVSYASDMQVYLFSTLCVCCSLSFWSSIKVAFL